MIAVILEQAGAIATPVSSAIAAMQVFEHAQFDVLVSDIGMPDLDGLLIRQIRALSPSQGGQIPAISPTAYAGAVDQQQTIQAGFQRHLSKPIEPDELIKAIACSFIAHSASADSLPT